MKNISAGDNFFRLGGHSLLAMQILIRLHQRLGVGFSIGFFLQHPTPESQTWAITEGLKERGLHEKGVREGTPRGCQTERTIPLRDPSVPCPLSPAQRSIWFLEHLHSGIPLYVESQAVRIRGRLDAKVVEAALNEVVARHEMLRTSIRVGNDGSAAQFAIAGITIGLRTVSRQGGDANWQDFLSEDACRPLELSLPPLLRATLIEIARDDYILNIVIHHIACDGYSLGIFFAELWGAYAALIAGRSYVPSPLPIQYNDYAAWKCSQVRSERVQQDIRYWKDRLERVPQLISWQIGSPRPPQNDYKGAVVALQTPSDLTERLRRLSQEEGVSLFTVVVAAFEVLLHRLSGQATFLLGKLPSSEGNRDF